jgi:hypothetical protein
MPTDPDISWLQSKCASQKVALHRLQARVENQRAVLRVLDLTDEQWQAIRAKLPTLDKTLVA